MHTDRVGVHAGRWMLCVLGSLALAACGGGGGSSASGSGSGGSGATTSYSIGGQVSGLSASGLVLADNGTDNLTVPSGSSTFTFATKLASGSTYAVTVATQPTGEACTVSSGTGTVSGNVTSVMVSCSANTYSIGGQISGLSASGLVLADNGADNRTVNSGSSTFTFSTKLASGSTYAVTVATQPTGQTCTVSSGTGTVASSNVTTVSVSCTTNTYTITGSATGLTAAGLKLQFYSTGQILSVAPVASGSAPFTYSNVPYGTALQANVIAAQPTWESCKVNSGDFSGTVTQNVTGYALTCAADTASASVMITTGYTPTSPDGVAVDSSGNVYVADTGASKIYMITPQGNATQIATGASPAFNSPDGIAVDSHGNVYVADSGNNLIREIVATNGVVSASSSVITLSTATFKTPEGVAVDSSGNVYVADTFDQEIREIEATNGSVSASSSVVTLAGSGTGCMDGDGTAAEFDSPTGVAVDDSSGSLIVYVADSNNNVIRKITSVGPTGTNAVTTWAGGQGTCNSLSPATAGFEDGAGATQALFADPTGVTVDSAGNVFVVDQGNNAVREITSTDLVTTLASASPSSGTNISGVPYAFNLPFGIAVDTSGNLYVSNTGDKQIVQLAP